MKKMIIAATMALAFAAQAECIMRSSSLTKVVGKISDIADTTALYGPSSKDEWACSIRSRVLYKGEWFTIFGEYTGPDVGRQDMCDNAVEITVRQFLASKEAKLLHSEQQMICSDEEPIKIRPTVKKGESVRLSEVRLNPNERMFARQGKECYWFIESSVKKDDVYQWNGIVCRQDGDSYIVVDKF